MALPPSFFSARTQRGLLALAGPAATLRYAERDAFIASFMRLRWWLLTVAMVLGRTAVDPQPHCDSAWVVSDAKTGNRGAGYRGGKWSLTSKNGWTLPFEDDMKLSAFPARDWKRILPQLESLPEDVEFVVAKD